MAQIRLRGIAWDHTRGMLPLLATAQRYRELHPTVQIEWHTRSLQAFGDQPIEQLAGQFDLLVIDHPFVGYAARHPVLLPLDRWLPAAFLADQAAGSVGASYASYEMGGHLWALPIDAATPVSAWREDLLDAPPARWSEVLHLARRGHVALPAIPIDSLMHFFMLCTALGAGLAADPEVFVPHERGAAALELLRELVCACDPACLTRNPIATYEALAAGDRLAYCPFAYGYSNYARAGYAPHRLRFGGLVALDDGTPLRSTLGGTGLAVAATAAARDVALDYARFVADPATQRGIYVAAGGQPGHRSAWLDPAVDAWCGGFFSGTLATLDAAHVRPRYAGYMHLQDHGGPLVQRYLRDGGAPRGVLEQLDARYRESRGHHD
jgi:multiple sugar transport system substrate-binding protein